ncbi:hypothetical protein DCAR_0104546 [Daucus carota subsp. sativus]|uniref:Replication protein A subunit n=1 Tax=Daucus carota subsp. sativus TaxID=79200 RepID=A0AAF0WC03_DAUCS|nr:PREDICTED: replication protein A 70 kDa DNA-binding subunit A-like [Daucus carota subsp. sativus]WOG85358.1 hypothetical protein DCAR_0104546 [Daucus carota subsp. sativus]
MVNLSGGSVDMICNSKDKHVDINPILQVQDVRIVQTTNSASERYRLLLSDGVFTVQGMLATQNNDLVKANKLVKGSVVKLNEFVCNRIQTRVIIIIVNLDLVLEQCETIGDPKPYPPIVDGPAKPSPASNISHSGNSNNPQYHNGNSVGAGLMPNNENVGVGSYMQAPGQGRSSGPPLYNSSLGSKAESGQYNQTTSGFGYSNTESATGISRSPMNNHVRPIQPAYPQVPPMYGNRGPIAKNGAPPRIIPIAALNPYQGRWTIKARVTAKGALKRYSNQRGEGKVFSFDLLDSDGGEIRATCFNAAADQFYHQIEDGKVYLISKGTLKPAQRNFNHLPNDHEIMLDSSSTVEPCFEGEHSIPQQRFQFRSVAEIEGIENNTVIDVIGVLCSISPSSPIMRKNGTETLKRALHIKDMSGRSVEVTLWGDFCNAEGQTLQNICDSGVFPVLAVKSAKVSDFNGKAVGTIPTSKVIIEPDIPEAHNLKAWMETDGKNAQVSSISRETAIGRQDVRKTISQIKDEKLGTSEKPDWITVAATLSYLKTDNFCYTACPLKIGERQCNKKVINNGDGTWRCERCDQSVEECDYRYILQFQIQDHTGLTWVTGFQEIGDEIFGIPAKDLYMMKNEDQDDEKFSEYVRKILFNKYLFKLKVKEETFSDEQRVKSTVVKVDKLNFVSETRGLLDLLNKLQGVDSSSVALKSENSVLNTGTNNAAYGSFGIKESAHPKVNYTGNVSSAGQGIGLPASQVGQFGNQNVGSRLASTGPTNAYMMCSTCGGMDHSSNNCPAAMDVQEHSYGGGFNNQTIPAGSGSTGGGGSGSGQCYKCHEHGHWANNCPNARSGLPGYGSGNVSTSAGGGGNGGECFKCHQNGHWAKDCPSAGGVTSGYGSGNVSASAGGGGNGGECFKCHQSGHWAKDCPSAGGATAGYGSGNVSSGRYGSASKQYVGGY